MIKQFECEGFKFLQSADYSSASANLYSSKVLREEIVLLLEEILHACIK